jgi:hypothetical protein
MEKEPKPANSVFELLAAIKKRPAMYLGFPSIRYLHCFLSGWFHRSYDVVTDAELFGEFTNWIAKKYKVKSSQNWVKIIEFWTFDEVQALELFYKLLEEFQTMKARQNKNKPSSK